jgi:hypothetical protein
MSMAPPAVVEEDGTSVDMSLFNERLRRQQYRQDLHDHRYHTDIYVLPKAKRLTHLVLHHCKYVSSLYGILNTPNIEEILPYDVELRNKVKRLSTDGLIICLSMANICAKHLPGSFATMPWRIDQSKDAMIEAIGKMAKTIEDIDHMGQTNPLGELWSEAMMLFSTYVSCLRLVGTPFWTVTETIEDRLLGVEAKHIWHNNYFDEIERLMEEYDSERIING